jgi:hypothetical protein
MCDYSIEKPPGSESCNGFGIKYFEDHKTLRARSPGGLQIGNCGARRRGIYLEIGLGS